jgi:hypothetical protein
MDWRSLRDDPYDWRPFKDAPKDGSRIMAGAIFPEDGFSVRTPFSVIVHWGCSTHGLLSYRSGGVCRSKPVESCKLGWLGEMGEEWTPRFVCWTDAPEPPAEFFALES